MAIRSQDFGTYHRVDMLPEPDGIMMAVFIDDVTELNAPLRTFVPRNASAVAGGWWDFSFLAYEPRHPIIVELARRATEEVLHQSLMVAVRHQFPCIGSVGCVLHTTGPMMCAAAR